MENKFVYLAMSTMRYSGSEKWGKCWQEESCKNHENHGICRLLGMSSMVVYINIIMFEWSSKRGT